MRPLDPFARNSQDQTAGPRSDEGPSTRPFGLESDPRGPAQPKLRVPTTARPDAQAPADPALLAPAIGQNTLHSATWVQRPIISYAPTAGPPDEAVPTLAGRYQIESLANRGNVSDTYFARHRVLGKSVVIEVLRPEHASDGDIAAQFLGEARAASMVMSAHLIDVLDFGKLADGGLYSILERLNGVPLAAAAQREGGISEEKIVAIASQIADGLSAAHAVGLYHGDLGIEQVILIPRDGDPEFVKLRGFGRVGLASNAVTDLLGAKEAVAQQTSERLKSIEFQRGARGDLEAVGALLYRLTSGLDPLRDKNSSPIPLHELENPPAVSPGLEAVIIKALSPRADQRYATVQELIDDLELLSRGAVPDALLEMIARSPSLVRPSPEIEAVQETAPLLAPPIPVIVDKPTSRSPWPTIAAVAAFLILSGLTLGVLFHAWLEP